MKPARIDEVKEGDVLYPDGGFTCVKLNDHLTIRKDQDGDLYFNCNHGGSKGRHYLAGQVNGLKEFVGLSKSKWA